MARYNPVARHQARRFAVQAIYQWSFTGISATELEMQFQTEYDLAKADIDYFREITQGVINKIAQLDDLIKPHLTRNLSEVDPVELAVLRIACFELSNLPDMPFRVVINEALQLTKVFGSVEGYKFVNGVLDSLVRQTRGKAES